MQPTGPKLAEGRESEIFEHGPGRVLRLARDGHSLEGEAEVMRYVRERGYPAPEVYEAGVGYLVMQRLEGPTMLSAALKRPDLLPRYGRLLASLHNQLHRIEAPPWLPPAGLPGPWLVHRDFHPINVLMTDAGPVVIDWSNPASGDPSYDVADVWILFATAQIPGSRLERVLATVGRRLFLRSFLSGVDAGDAGAARAARAAIPDVVRIRLTDPNMTEVEKARMRKLSAWATRA